MSFKLKELLDEKGYIRGPFGSALRRNELLDEGIPVYEQQNAIYNNREFRYFINNEKYEEMKRFTVRENDLIISCSGTVGRVSVIRKDDPIGIISQALLILRPNTEKVLTDFLFYFFTSRIGYNSIISRSGGSVQANISKRAVIENIDIDVPPLPEQKSIVNILSALDKKIEVNNQINKTLESMAQAIFKQWFVDFEFPNEDGEPYKSSGGEMVESELGMIPKGWEVKELGEIIDIHDSKRIPLSKNEREKREKIYPYYGAASLMDYVDEFIFDGIYVLLGEDGTVVNEDGSPVLQYVWGKFWVNNHAHVLSGKKGVSINFLYILLSNLNVSGAITGAVQLKINQKNLKEMKIIMPNDMKLVSQFSDIVDKSFEKTRVKRDENKNLVLLRDSLLPKLMSGEIRVSLDEEGDAS